MPGSDHLRKAAQTLLCHDLELRTRVLEAGRELESAHPFRDTWPADVRQRAEQIMSRLTLSGTIVTTVLGMDEDQIHQMADDILDFIELAEKLPTVAEIECE